MRIMASVAGCALALAATAFARAQTSPPAAFTTSEYIEAHRPRPASRPPTSAERDQARTLIRRIDGVEATWTQLDQLLPVANAGDRVAMRALMQAYDRGGPRIAPPPLDGDLSRISRPLAGLWAARLWQAGERDREVSRNLANCLGLTRGVEGRRTLASGRSEVRDCGFSMEFDGSRSAFSNHWTGRGREPGHVVFTERPLAGPEVDQRRFEGVISALRTQRPVFRIDRAWAEAWSRREGGPRAELFADTVVLVERERAQAEAARLAAATAARARHVAQWEALQTRQTQNGSLTDTERADWAFASAVLGGDYLETYARYYPLVRAWEVEEVCGVNPRGDPCQRQTELQAYLSSGTRPTFETGQGDVSVRVYDQGGNYQGNTTVPSWALSFISRH